MRHTSGICSCPKQGEEMTGKDPLDRPEFRFDRRAFRDDEGRNILRGYKGEGRIEKTGTTARSESGRYMGRLKAYDAVRAVGAGLGRGLRRAAGRHRRRHENLTKTMT